MDIKTKSHRCSFLLPLAAFSALLGLQSVSAQAVNALDDFDSYSVGNIPAGAFPSTSPGGVLWESIPTAGFIDIVAAPAGRTGNVLQVSDTGTTSGTLPSVTFDIPTYDGSEPWEISLDFRVETPSSANFTGAGVLRLLGNSGIIGSISTFRNDSTTDFNVFTHAFDSGNSNSFGAGLQNLTWYTLTLIGDDTAGTISASIDGGAASVLTYAGTSTTLTGFQLGDQSDSSLTNSVMLFDDFSFAAIPEPASYATIFSVVTFALVGLRRRRR